MAEVAKRCRKATEQHPPWFPDSYDLRSEVEHFVARFDENEKNNADNHWILKAWNFSQGMTTVVSNNLAEILRRRECSVPFLVSKYVHEPILISSANGLVKFDFRYHIIVQSFRPLRAFALKRFWPKLAIVPYNLELIEDLQRHLTNISISNERTQPWFTDFVRQIESETTLDWERDVQLPTLVAIRDLLEAAALKDPPEGICQNNNSRYISLFGLYVITLILEPCMELISC